MNVRTLSKMSKTAEKFVIDNAPAILTVIGVVGTAATAYLTGKATFEAADKIEDARFMKHVDNAAAMRLSKNEMSKTEKFKLVWMCYIPPAVAGVTTVGAVILANRISARRAAAMAVAYSISQNQLAEYKEKVLEKFGKTKEQNVRDEIAQDTVDRNPVGKNEVIITGGGEVLCFDKYTGRYFMGSMDMLKKAENDVNFYILNNDYVNLNDFYRLIGLPTVPIGEEVGWTREFNFEIIFSTTISENGKPCIVTDFQVCGVRRRPSSPGLKAVGYKEE